MPKVIAESPVKEQDFVADSEIDLLKRQLAEAQEKLQIAEARDRIAESHPEMERYLIVTQVPDYTGKVFGIPINHGVGILDVSSLDPKLGHDLSRVLTELGSWDGYRVIQMAGRSVEEAIKEIRDEQRDRQARVDDLVQLLANADVAQKVREAMEAVRR